MRINDKTRVMTLGRLPFTHSINPFLGSVGSLGEATEQTGANLRLGAALALTAIGTTLSGVHGYYRNRKSMSWAAGWALLGLIMPIPTLAYAAGQGFAKKAK